MACWSCQIAEGPEFESGSLRAVYSKTILYSTFQRTQKKERSINVTKVMILLLASKSSWTGITENAERRIRHNCTPLQIVHPIPYVENKNEAL